MSHLPIQHKNETTPGRRAVMEKKRESRRYRKTQTKHGKTGENVEKEVKTGRIRGKHRKALGNCANQGKTQKNAKTGETQKNTGKHIKTRENRENQGKTKKNSEKQGESVENIDKQYEKTRRIRGKHQKHEKTG